MTRQEAAETAGYGSPRAFIAAFRKVFGTTPHTISEAPVVDPVRVGGFSTVGPGPQVV